MVFARLRQCAPHLIHAILGPTRVLNPNGISIVSAVFAQLTAERPFTMGRPAPFPSLLKIAPSHGGSGPHLIHDSLGPPEFLNPNGISIGSAVFVGLTSVTDRSTDHATWSVTTGRIYVRSTAMRPTNTISQNHKVAVPAVATIA